MASKIVVMASGAGTNFGAILDAISRGVLDAEVVALVVNRKHAGARLLAEKAGVACHYMPLAPYRSTSSSHPSGQLGRKQPSRKSSGSQPSCKRSGSQPTSICAQSRHWTEDAERLAYDSDLAEMVGRLSPDLVVLAGWMHLLSPVFLDCFPRKVINLHPALPGQFPGNNAIEDAWKSYRKTLEGSQTLESLSAHPHSQSSPTQRTPLMPPPLQSAHPMPHSQSARSVSAAPQPFDPQTPGTPQQSASTGVMVHYVTDAGVDNGAVVKFVEVPMYPSDALDVLRARIRAAEHKLLVSAISEVLL